MAELLPLAAIAGPNGYPSPYFIARWRTVGRALPTWRALPPAVAIHDGGGNSTADYRRLFSAVFGVSVDPQNAIVHIRDGTPTRLHREDWRKIP